MKGNWAATCPVLLDMEKRGTLNVDEWLTPVVPPNYARWADNQRRGVPASTILGVLSEHGYTKPYHVGTAATRSPPQRQTPRGGGPDALSSPSSASSSSSADTARYVVRSQVVLYSLASSPAAQRCDDGNLSHSHRVRWCMYVRRCGRCRQSWQSWLS